MKSQHQLLARPYKNIPCILDVSHRGSLIKFILLYLHSMCNIQHAQKLLTYNLFIKQHSARLSWLRCMYKYIWFSDLNDLNDKPDKTFIKFDIVEFYPSISEELLEKAVSYAKSICAITEQQESIIWHSRKSLLFNEKSTWTKKDGSLFDVTMGSFDGAEICELVGLYILNLLSSTFNKDQVGLYRDDGLAALKLSGPQSDRARKDIIQIFKECGLRVTVEILLHQTDFLDVTFDLPTGRYWPFCKPSNDPLYIHAKSNHPPTILKHLPNAICSRLCSISSDSQAFNKAKPPYENALKNSGHQSDMEYTIPQRKSRNRKRNVIWFNPPFNQNVTTNVARNFLELVDKHFPHHHRYHKLFNRNNVKNSYSCLSNMATIISGHNAKVLTPAPPENPRTCNCRTPDNCPLSGKCLTKCVVYRATVTAPPKPVQHYYGLTEGPFKTRFNSHTHSFRSKVTLSYPNTYGISRTTNSNTKSNGTLYTLHRPTNAVHDDATSASQRKW